MATTEQRLAKLHANQKIENSGETKIDRRKFNHGTPQSGRKPKEANLIAAGIKTYLDSHFTETMTIELVENGKTVTVEKPRLLLVLEKLYEIGMKNEDPDALNKWLDRALGKPMQPIKGDDEAPPIRLQVNIAAILTKAYATDPPGAGELHTQG